MVRRLSTRSRYGGHSFRIELTKNVEKLARVMLGGDWSEMTSDKISRVVKKSEARFDAVF